MRTLNGEQLEARILSVVAVVSYFSVLVTILLLSYFLVGVAIDSFGQRIDFYLANSLSN
jgi:hypothetical protein